MENFFLSKSVSGYFKTKKRQFLMATKPRGRGGVKALELFFAAYFKPDKYLLVKMRTGYGMDAQ